MGAKTTLKFQEGKFSKYMDFDLSQRNIRIFDLCYFMLGLLLRFFREIMSKRFKLYNVDIKYIQNLHNVDDNGIEIK